MRKISVSGALLVMMAMNANAQNMSSPYSVYGVGEIQNTWSDRSSGMANTSVSLISTPGFLLNKNPASLIGLERSMGQVDLGLVGRTTTFRGTPISSSNSSAHDVMINKFSLSTKLNNHWASSVGFTPFSYVSYSFAGNKSIEGSGSTYSGQYDGNGGLHHIYWNNAFAIGKHVAMGLRSSFIFGSINQIETVQGAGVSVPIESTVQNYYNNLRFEYGAIYNSKITKNWKLSLGGKITTKTDLHQEKTLTVMEGSTAIEQNKDLGTGSFSLPWQYDAGIALINKGRTTFSVDYSFANWDGLNGSTGSSTWAMVNSQRISAGFQLSNQVQRFGMVAEKSYFQAGVYTGQSYLQVKGQQINEFGVTAGYGGYLSRGLSYGLALEGGSRGTITSGLVRENYVQLTLSLSYREILYSKGRKYD
jgi:hypothetical protein